MRKRSEKLRIVKPDTFHDLPKLKKNQVLLSCEDANLMDDSCRPYANDGNWPEWWKALSGSEGGLKRCSGTSDYLATGFTIPLWAKLMIRPSINGQNWDAQFDLVPPCSNFRIESFSYEQTGECPVSKVRKLKKSNYVKVINPWLVKTPPGWSSLFLPPLWDPNPNYTMLPAVVNTDYYHNAHMVINVLTDEPFELEIGRPMWHVIPFKRNKETTLLWGNKNAYNLLRHRGFGGGFMPTRQKSKYKKLQRDADSQLVEQKKTLFDKIARRED
jgi:hypothetical protein